MKDGAKLRVSYSDALKKERVGLRQADREPCSTCFFPIHMLFNLLGNVRLKGLNHKLTCYMEANEA